MTFQFGTLAVEESFMFAFLTFTLVFHLKTRKTYPNTSEISGFLSVVGRHRSGPFTFE